MEILANPGRSTYHLLEYNPDYPGYGHDDIVEYFHPVPELEAPMRQAMVLHNQYRWDRARTGLIPGGALQPDDFVVVFHPRTEDVLQFIRRAKRSSRLRVQRPAPAESRRPVTPYAPVDVRARFRVMPRLEPVAVFKGERADRRRRRGREHGTPLHPDGGPGSMLDAIDLVVPHQANKTMVVKLAQAAGLAPERLYFNIQRVGKTSSASIPLAL